MWTNLIEDMKNGMEQKGALNRGKMKRRIEEVASNNYEASKYLLNQV